MPAAKFVMPIPESVMLASGFVMPVPKFVMPATESVMLAAKSVVPVAKSMMLAAEFMMAVAEFVMPVRDSVLPFRSSVMRQHIVVMRIAAARLVEGVLPVGAGMAALLVRFPATAGRAPWRECSGASATAYKLVAGGAAAVGAGAAGGRPTATVAKAEVLVRHEFRLRHLARQSGERRRPADVVAARQVEDRLAGTGRLHPGGDRRRAAAIGSAGRTPGGEQHEREEREQDQSRA